MKPHKTRKASVKAPVPTEHAEQAALIDWWGHYARSKGIDERLLFAIPNGANKSIPQAMKYKREGLRAGVPDLMLAVAVYKAKETWFGLFLEMKRKSRSVLSTEQKQIIDLLRRRCYRVKVCYGADEGIRAIKEYLA